MPTSRPTIVRLATTAFAVAFAACAAPALAIATCYTVYDAPGEIVYRDVTLPFADALDPASPGREKMRVRGENLVFFEADYCVPVSNVGGLGGRTYTTDEIVSTFPGYATRPDGSTVGSRTFPGGVPAAVPAFAPSTGGLADRVTAPATNAVNMRMGTYR